MTTEVQVSLGQSAERSYGIKIAPGILSEVPKIVTQIFPTHSVAIITDTTVGDLYAHILLDGFSLVEQRPCHLYVFPAGESSKTRETKAMLEDAMFANRHDRRTVILALGGGVTGDLAGYLAATYMRGIPFVQIPTTLLAQVDSSVGGKTGVDVPAGKNLVGAFWQPACVCIDPMLLASLPESEFQSGMGEIVKHALMFSPDLLTMLDASHHEIMARDPEVMAELVAKNCSIKTSVVSEDETETGLRKTLNFGHTVGHAIELESDFSIAHGIAVMLGMLVELQAAESSGLITPTHLKSMQQSILRYLPAVPKIRQLDSHRLVQAMLLDKKNVSGQIHCSLPLSPGVHPQDPDWTQVMTAEQLERSVDEVFSDSILTRN